MFEDFLVFLLLLLWPLLPGGIVFVLFVFLPIRCMIWLRKGRLTIDTMMVGIVGVAIYLLLQIALFGMVSIP